MKDPVQRPPKSRRPAPPQRRERDGFTKVPRNRDSGIAAFRMVVEYQGGAFVGWQKQGPSQDHVKTVAGTIEKALRQNGIEPLQLMGSGRTDSGVHALGQVAHIHLPAEFRGTQKNILRLLRDHLPGSIVVKEMVAVPAEFHARHHAHDRSYLYQLSTRPSAFAKPFIWWVKDHIREEQLDAAWKAFEGFHDFSAFAHHVIDGDPRALITSCEWTREGQLILLRVRGSHFLRRQVRRMVGAAVAVATGEAKLETLKRDLQDSDKQANTFWSELSAPASGLFLEQVRYGADEPIRPFRSVTPVE